MLGNPKRGVPIFLSPQFKLKLFDYSSPIYDCIRLNEKLQKITEFPLTASGDPESSALCQQFSYVTTSRPLLHAVGGMFKNTSYNQPKLIDNHQRLLEILHLTGFVVFVSRV